MALDRRTSYHHVTLLDAGNDNVHAMRGAFELSSSLIRCGDYHAMTNVFLRLVDDLPGVLEVSAYEVFYNGRKRTDGIEEIQEMFFRRFRFP